ncbi:UNVERIFIED_CONTAM: hypothetical protein Sradi_4300600 [Sesamum radiatum]|uniref:Uncharacterized protein n=1 Tax=Sesamum radiatum TaxID=300843 RepID=A0AAW2NP75_SESRA
MSQLASSVSHLEFQGKLLSQTISNPKQNVSAITLCSEKELQFENNTRRGHAEHGKIGEELEITPKQAKKFELTYEEHPKVFVPKLPFPERFAKSKKEKEEKDILETLRKVEVNIPLLDVIKRIPRYAKFLKEMCTTKSKLRGNEWPSLLCLAPIAAASLPEPPPTLPFVTHHQQFSLSPTITVTKSIPSSSASHRRIAAQPDAASICSHHQPAADHRYPSLPLSLFLLLSLIFLSFIF